MDLLWSNRITKSEADIIISRSEKNGIEPNQFMFLSDLESGLDPYRVNDYGCRSWIQFCPDKAGLNYKTIKGTRYYFSDMDKMTPEQLLNLSFDYLEEQQSQYGRFSDVYDLYFSILYPSAIGKPDDYVLNTQTNPLFDINKNGSITVGEVKKYLSDRVKLKVPTAYWNSILKKKTFCSYIKEKSFSSESLQLVS